MFYRIIGICGLVALLSVPLTLMVYDWRFSWLAVAKLILGLGACLVWIAANASKLKTDFPTRPTFYGSFSGFLTLLLLLILILANYISYQLAVRIDLTTNRVLSLSPQTLDLLKQLQDKLTIEAYLGPNEPVTPKIRELLERYRYASDKILYEFIDPMVQIDRVEKEKITPTGARLVFRYQSRQIRVRIGSNPQEDITNAILALSTPKRDQQTLCFSQGHLERPMKRGVASFGSFSLWTSDLRAEGFEINSLDLTQLEAIPTPCSVLFLIGPKRFFSPNKLDIIDAYLKAGGHLMALIGANDTSSLNDLLRRYGIELGQRALIDPTGNTPFEVTTATQHSSPQHPIIADYLQDLSRRSHAILPLAQSVSRLEQQTDFANWEILFSNGQTWAEKDSIQQVSQVSYDSAQDSLGPHPMGVVVTSNSSNQEKPKTKIVVFGSSAFVNNRFYGLHLANRQLINTSLAWMIKNQKSIRIRPRLRATSLLRIPKSDIATIALITSDLLPISLLALGIIIWQIRRRS